MFPEDAFFFIAAHFVLGMLATIGAIAAVWSRNATKPEYQEGVQLTRDPYLIFARICFMAGCVTIWVCTLLAYVNFFSPTLLDFWQVHRATLRILFVPIDAVFATSVPLALQCGGRGGRTLLIATSSMAVASILGSILLWIPE